MECALAAGLRHAQSRDPELRHETLFGELLARLQNLCGARFDVFSAGMSQAAVLRRMTPVNVAVPPLPPLRDPPPLDAEASRRLEEETCGAFDRHRRDKHSFTTAARQGRFSSPNELRVAENYLRSTRDA